MARNLPSWSSASSAVVTWSRPWASETKDSLRSAVHFTGRLSCLAAERPDVAGVVGSDFVDGRFFSGGNRIDDRRQHLVVDLHQLGGVPRLLRGLGHHDRYGVSYIPRLSLSEAGVRRLLHRLAVDV